MPNSNIVFIYYVKPNKKFEEREKIETTSPLLANETAPDHDTGAVLDSGDC